MHWDTLPKKKEARGGIMSDTIAITSAQDDAARIAAAAS